MYHATAAEFIPLAQLGTTDDCGFAPFGDDADLDIFEVGSCRSVIFAVSRTMYAEGTVKVWPVVITPEWSEGPPLPPGSRIVAEAPLHFAREGEIALALSLALVIREG